MAASHYTRASDKLLPEIFRQPGCLDSRNLPDDLARKTDAAGKDLKSQVKDQLKNQVLCEDVIAVLKSLPNNSVDMIYGDPDYNVGINYSGSKYKMHWEEYIKWYIELTRECLRVMKQAGNGFMINYPKQNAHLRVRYLDEQAHAVHDYSWVYNSNVGHSPRRFTTAHRSILHFTKTKHNNFYKDQVALPYKNPDDRRIKQRLAQGHKGRMPYSWFYFDLVKNVSKDKTFHACQIPLPLFEMLLQAATKENDKVFILFGGSGSEIMSALRLNRSIISCELNKEYYQMIIDRMQSGDKNLAKYRLKKTNTQLKSGSDSMLN